MPSNTDPIYSRSSDVQIAGAIVGPSANTATDGTGANAYRVLTADSTNGGFVNRVIFKPVGTTAATVARLFYCSDTGTFTAGTTNTAANSAIVGEVTMAAWTASNTVASPEYSISVNFALPPSTKLFVTFGTSTGAAGNGFNPLVIAGKY